ncbi:MAG: RNA polymerase sigma factor [Chitinophagales bacterium]
MVEDFDSWLVDFKAGKKEATNSLYNEYRPFFVKWLVKKHHCSKEDAIDVFHDSIIVLYKNAQKGKLDVMTSQLKTYLFGIGRNIFFERLRKKTPITSESPLELMEAAEMGIEKKLQLSDRKKMMAQLLKRMADPCKSIIYLFYYRQYSIEAIQKNMNYKSSSVVRTQKKRCVSAFKKQFEKALKKSDI